MRAHNFKNEIGNKYGTLTVVRYVGKTGSAGHTSWICECDCGGTHVTTGTSLREGRVLHCKECERLGKFFVGKKVYSCVKIEEKE